MVTIQDIDALAQAAGKGEVVQVKALLAAGVQVDAVGTSGITPLCHAAACGEAGMVRELLAARADINASQPVPLFPAATGPEVELMRSLVQATGGKANAPSDTPLIFAATFGYLNVVRILLDAGADPNLRRGARQTNALEAARYNRHKAVMEALLQAGALPGSGEFAFKECKQFGKAATEPAYQEIANWLAGMCGHKPRPWKKRKGVFQFSLQDFGALATFYPNAGTPLTDDPRGTEIARRERLIFLLQDQVRAAGFYLVLSDSLGYNSPAELRLFPTKDKFAVIAASGTHGGNRGHTTGDVIDWLLALDKDNPFALTLCSYQSLGGTFLQPLKNTRNWAEKMLQFAPPVDEMTPDALAAELEKWQTLFFGWL